MKRKIYQDLVNWKHKDDRLPLILRGARQVGKSYILEEFGKYEFVNYHIFDFEKDGKHLKPLFEEELSPQRILKNLALFQDQQIDVNNDLLILDEIQNCPKALTSLKYFQEDMPELAVCAAGSLLGIHLSEASFPVGKVAFLDMYPLSFEEFLLNHEKKQLHDCFEESFQAGEVSSLAHSLLWEQLKEYYIIGGMPKVVKTYFEKYSSPVTGFHEARVIQQELLEAYKSDFTKHAGKVNSLHIASVFDSIPLQLAGYMDGSVQRYRFKGVIPGKKSFAELEGAIDWLIKAGLIIKVPICQQAQIPLKVFTKPNIFKLFIFDIGLLGCMLELTPQTLLAQDYGLIKGFFAENYVANDFIYNGEKSLYSWSERNSEIEFIKACDSDIIPIEVKSSLRVKAKSLRQYIIKYNPTHAVIISGKPLKQTTGVTTNLPLYYAGKFIKNIRTFFAS